MKVRYNAEALREMAAIADYLRPLNPEAGARVRAAIEATVRIILESPWSGRIQDVPGVRKAVTRHGYLIFYRVDEAAQAIDVLGIQHPARDRPYNDA